MDLSTTTLFDALIIGAGPAGLSAALALCRMKRTSVVFSTEAFRNARAHRAHTVLGFDHVKPAEIRRVGREQVQAYGTTKFVERAVTKASKSSDGRFEVTDSRGAVWRGRKVVLAMGAKDVLPTEIEGYEDCWGESIYQCLFCDGLERSEEPAGMLGWSAMSGHIMDFLFLLAPPSITIFANGSLKLEDEVAKRALEIAKARGAAVDERQIRRFIHLPDNEGIEIVFQDGESTRVGFLQHSPPTEVIGASIAQDLGVEVLDDGRGGTVLKTNAPFGETNVKGVFAVGDSGALMKQVTVAMQSGVGSGAAIAMQLGQEADEGVAGRLWPDIARTNGVDKSPSR